jgi:hypothetical protein
LKIYLRLIHNHVQVGEQALAGKDEYINVKLFDAVGSARTKTGRGMSIIVYDLKADPKSAPSWEHHNTSEDGTGDVPAGYKVRVIGATVKFK